MFNGRTFSCIVVLSAAVVALSACQGEDTFSRQSNPLEKYDSVTRDPRRYDSAEHQREYEKIKKTEAIQQKPCAVPFALSIEGERGKIVNFKEEQEKTIVLHVDSQLEDGGAWDVKVLDPSPCPKCFSKVSKDDKSAVYKYTWKPAKGSADNIEGNILTLRYFWTPEARCATLPITEPITLNVKKDGDNKPVVTIPGLPTETVKFGAPAVAIQVLVNDPSVETLNDKAPEISFKKSKEKGVLPLNTAISCADTGKQIEVSPGTIASSFDCTFDSSLFAKDPRFKSLSGSGKTVDAVFAIEATSGVSKATSTSTVRVKVLFEKIKGKGAANGADKDSAKKAEGV